MDVISLKRGVLSRSNGNIWNDYLRSIVFSRLRSPRAGLFLGLKYILQNCGLG